MRPSGRDLPSSSNSKPNQFSIQFEMVKPNAPTNRNQCPDKSPDLGSYHFISPCRFLDPQPILHQFAMGHSSDIFLLYPKNWTVLCHLGIRTRQWPKQALCATKISSKELALRTCGICGWENHGHLHHLPTWNRPFKQLGDDSPYQPAIYPDDFDLAVGFWWSVSLMHVVSNVHNRVRRFSCENGMEYILFHWMRMALRIYLNALQLELSFHGFYTSRHLSSLDDWFKMVSAFTIHSWHPFQERNHQPTHFTNESRCLPVNSENMLLLYYSIGVTAIFPIKKLPWLGRLKSLKIGEIPWKFPWSSGWIRNFGSTPFQIPSLEKCTSVHRKSTSQLPF